MKTIQRMLLGVVVLTSMWSCNLNEKAQLRATVDSLRTELKDNEQLAQTLNEVGSLIDSIDMNRQVLRTDVIEGTSYDNYAQRLVGINDYVKQTYQKIAALEETVRKSKSNNAYFATTIKKLKADLESRAIQIAELEKEVERVRGENLQLTASVKAKEDEINKKLEVIQINEQNIASLETKVSELGSKAIVDQADAYYRQAMALETAAQRTKFAPKKRKATTREALELYKLAASLGKTEAETKVAQLEKSI
jgi:chromosome segregation ATPase